MLRVGFSRLLDSVLPTELPFSPYEESKDDPTHTQKLQKQDDDNSSVPSVDTVEMTQDEERQVTLRFTQAVYEKLQSDLRPTGSNDCFRETMDRKLRKFSKAVKKDSGLICFFLSPSCWSHGP